MLQTLPLLTPSPGQTTFSWTNLVIFAVVVAVVVPLVSRLRASVTRRRRERWAREEGWPSDGADGPEAGDAGRGRRAP